MTARPARDDDDAPAVVLFVDRPALVALFDASELAAPARLAVVSVDGQPAARIAFLQARFRSGHRAAVLYVHDAATVVYPFDLEPLATLAAHAQASGQSIAYEDLGLSPLGTTARRFGDPSLARDAIVTTLDTISPAALVRYCIEAARRLSDRADRRTAASR